VFQAVGAFRLFTGIERLVDAVEVAVVAY